MTVAVPTAEIVPAARRLRRKHGLMLLLAVEVMAYGAWQAGRHRDRPYTLIEIPATPNHVVT